MITVLTSGVALGVHVPGLLLVRRLQEAGAAAQVEVLERLLPAEARERIVASKTAFHRDFRVAVAGHRLVRDPADLLDEGRVGALFARWRAQGCRRFVVLSGFWLSILERFGGDVEVDACHVDSVRSPSFAAAPAAVGGRDVWLIDAERGEVPWTIPVTDEDPVSWCQRAGRVLAHGGGWGMGTYAERGAELAAHGLGVDVVTYEDAPPTPGVRPFRLDPGWQPWDDDGFPPFGPVGADGHVPYRRSERHHGSFDLARRSLAMVSKPGGGTLLDSLSAATPVVLAEPLGDHEARNAELWQELGFGIDADEWRASGFSLTVLADLHRNLVAARAAVPSYVTHLLEETVS